MSGFGRDYPVAEVLPPDEPGWRPEVVLEDAPDPYPFVTGGSFILDGAENPEPLWGSGEEVLLADGEALIIAGGQGLGKTTLAQQLALGRCGFAEYEELLGYAVTPGERVLYLAMDRPRQVARSFRRMVGESWRAELDERLAIWQGPPPADIAQHPSLLHTLCRRAGADTVVVDSLKDAAVGLTDDEVGAGYNRARQMAITAGVQVIELHHQRKHQQGAQRGAPTIDDLYGSTWLPSGAGSVVVLTGAPGDPIVGLHHVKQPATEVGPLKVVHDHEAGRSRVWQATDLVGAAAACPDGLSAVEAARILFDTVKPSAAEKEKARRKLEKLERGGQLTVVESGDKGANAPRRWGR